MKCPYCGFKESKVVDSRPAEEGNSIRRRRECRKRCGAWIRIFCAVIRIRRPEGL